MILIFTYVVFKAYQFKSRFKKYGVPHPKEIPFLGRMGENIYRHEQTSILVKNLYNFNREAKYIGFHSFSSPVLLIRDLDLIKSVLVKNFDHFADHKKMVEELNDPLFGNNLTFLNGERWKEVRTLLSPSFTFCKMRGMFAIMANCAENFTEQFLKLHGHKEAIDMKDAFSRYANDVIASCGFGIEVDSIKNPKNDFYLNGKSASLNSPSAFFKIVLIEAFPNLSKKLGIRIISKKVTDFFVNVVETTMKTRREKGITRPDMLQLMMEAREKNDTFDMDILEMTAQVFIFILGGFDTTSDNMCMIAYELAVNPDVQKKLQDEIDEMMKQCNLRKRKQYGLLGRGYNGNHENASDSDFESHLFERVRATSGFA